MSTQAPPASTPAPRFSGGSRRRRRQAKSTGVIELVRPFIKEQLGWFFAGFLLLPIFAIITGVLTANAFQAIIDEGFKPTGKPLGELFTTWIVLLVFALVIRIPSGFVTRRIFIHLTYRLRMWVYERLQRISPRELDALPAGQLVTRTLSDLAAFELLLLLLPGIFTLIPVVIGIFFVLLTRSVPLTLLVTLSIPVNLYLVRRMAKPLWGLSWMQSNQRAQVTTVVDEAVRGIRTVKAFGREEHERGRLATVAATAFGFVMRRTRFLAKYDFLTKLVPTLIDAFVLGFAGWLILTGRMTLGAFAVFLSASAGIEGLAQAFDGFVSGWQVAKNGAGRLYELVGGQKRRVEAGGAPLPDVSTGLVMSGVGVSFGGRPVLEGFDLEIRPGALVAVLGGPRSGKSTIAALASGRIQPDDGEILLEDWDLSRLHPQRLRREVRVLSEEPFLFGRTVRENLEMGAAGATGGLRPKVSDDVLGAALRAAAADGIVAELGGLDVEIGDRGLTLSGGERQRLALARALVSPPRILILDDALFGVNATLELDILRRIRDHAAGMSVVVLTRRAGPSTIADLVVSLPAADDDSQPVLEAADDDSPMSTLRRDAPYSAQLAGIVQGLQRGDDEKPPVTDAQVNASDKPPTILNLLSPFKMRIAFVTLLLLGQTLFGNFPTLLRRTALDSIETTKNLDLTLKAAAGIAGIALVLSIVAYASRILRTRVQESITYMLRRRTFKKVTSLGVDFYDRELPGDTATRMVYDLDRVADFSDEGPYRIATAVMVLISAFVILVIWSPAIAVIGGLFLPVIAVLLGLQFPILDKLNRLVRAETGKTIARLEEDFSGRYVINTYGTQGWAKAAFDEQATKVRSAQMRLAVIEIFFGELTAIARDAQKASVLYAAGVRVRGGTITPATGVLIQDYIDRALRPIQDLARLYRSYLTARASFIKIREPFEAPILPVEKQGARNCEELSGRITLDGVSFTYPGTKRTVLEDISLDIAPGKIVALVGPTGAGKTSIAKLISRFYDPAAGTVLADGTDIRDFKSTSYRERLGVVPQEVFCFRGTVASNLRYGWAEATEDDFEEAAKALGAYEALSSIPGGWNGTVDEEGRNLTAAQRQLIGLVRAWLTDPDVLILDEATGTLSEALERRVLESVAGLGRTTVFVTHRIQVAERADVVVVIDGGRIVETGRHADLVNSGGPYSQLWALGRTVSEPAVTVRKARKPAAATTKVKAVAAKVKAVATNGRKASAKTNGEPARDAKTGRVVKAAAPAGNGAKAKTAANGAKAKGNGAAKKVQATLVQKAPARGAQPKK